MALLDFIKAEITNCDVVDIDDLSAFAADEALQRLLRKSARRLIENFREMEEFREEN